MRQISGHSRRNPFAQHFIGVTADGLSSNERCGRFSLVCLTEKLIGWKDRPNCPLTPPPSLCIQALDNKKPKVLLCDVDNIGKLLDTTDELWLCFELSNINQLE